jgi:hypothetical protein
MRLLNCIGTDWMKRRNSDHDLGSQPPATEMRHVHPGHQVSEGQGCGQEVITCVKQKCTRCLHYAEEDLEFYLLASPTFLMFNYYFLFCFSYSALWAWTMITQTTNFF